MMFIFQDNKNPHVLIFFSLAPFSRLHSPTPYFGDSFSNLQIWCGGKPKKKLCYIKQYSNKKKVERQLVIVLEGLEFEGLLT